MSTYELLGWPIQITVTPFTVAIIAAVAPYLAGTKMGSWEIPEVTDRLNRILQFAGPVFLASILFGYFPFWSKADSFDLGDYNAGAFQISNKKMTVDLSLRRQVGQETRKKVRVSPAKWGTTLKIRKSANAPDRFFKEFWTSGLPPDVHCFSHPFEFEELPYVPSSGRENMRRYGLFVDITDEEPNVEFVIRYQYLFWNSFQAAL